MTELRKLTFEQAEATKKYAERKGCTKISWPPQDGFGTYTLHYHKPKGRRLEEAEICEIIKVVGDQLKMRPEVKKKIILRVRERSIEIPYIPDVIWYTSEEYGAPYAIFEVEWVIPNKRKLLSALLCADMFALKKNLKLCSQRKQ